MKALHQITYALFGLGMLAIGVVGFLLPFGFFPDLAEPYDEESLHLAQEASAAVIALGLLAMWCAKHYAQSRAGHWILTLFFVLIAAMHWADYFHEARPVSSALLNSIPGAIFIALGTLRQRELRV